MSLHLHDVHARRARQHGGMLLTGSPTMDAERAFTRAKRARRRAAVVRWVRRQAGACAGLPVYDDGELARGVGRPARGVREIPLDAIRGTLEPSRARLFDCSFRPAAGARARWQRLWVAEHLGVVLPPISVVAIGDAYALRDGHHRVSVAAARGAATIDAIVDAAI
jgi:hypothetical protein